MVRVKMVPRSGQGTHPAALALAMGSSEVMKTPSGAGPAAGSGLPRRLRLASGVSPLPATHKSPPFAVLADSFIVSAVAVVENFELFM